jgi:aspartate/glutamate racemase
MAKKPRIALIHATPIAVDPIRLAFEAGWSDAETVDIMDYSLSPDRAAVPDINEALTDRIITLARYARTIGSDGILFTCSAYGSAIEKAASLLDIPVLKPNEAMFEGAMDRGTNIAMIATFPPARETMEDEFAEEARHRSDAARLTTFVVEPAIVALRGGDAATHNRLIAEKAAELKGFDALMLAHFSTSRAAEAVRGKTSIPVLTSPDAAVAKIRRLVAG